jgi:hypothetical protein
MVNHFSKDLPPSTIRVGGDTGNKLQAKEVATSAGTHDLLLSAEFPESQATPAGREKRCGPKKLILGKNLIKIFANNQ